MIASESSLKIGTVLYNGELRYQITDVIGQGGFGITYLAIGEIKVGNVTTQAKFAVKEHFPSDYCKRQGLNVIPDDDKVADYERSKANFISEALKIHTLGTQNENIVKVNEVFQENQTAYYIMQYINGVSLKEFVESKKKLSYSEAISLLLPIVNAVDFLHSSRINHLDIKPDNIMLHDSIDGKVPVLIDFGLSLHFKKNGEKTSSLGIIGVTEGYSPLEQYAGIREFNPATDIYAMAATILFALTGIEPKGASDLRLSEVREALVKLAPQQAIDALCKALQKSYEDRTSSVSAFKADLGVVSNSGKNTVTISQDDEQKKKKIVIISSCLIILAIAIIGFLLLKPSKKSVVLEEPIPVSDTISPTSPEPLPNPEPSTQPSAQASEPVSSSTQAPTVTTPSAPSHTTPSSPQHSNAEPPKPMVTSGTLSLGYGTWQGGIKNGKPDGKGRLTFVSTHVVDRHSSVEANPGDYFDATYDNGSLISGKLYDSTGNLLKTIIP